MLDWQRSVVPVLRATYDLMDEGRTDMLDGDELASLITADKDGSRALQRLSVDQPDGLRGRPVRGRHDHSFRGTHGEGLTDDARLARARAGRRRDAPAAARPADCVAGEGVDRGFGVAGRSDTRSQRG